MATPALLYSVAILILSISLAASCVLVCWRWASASTRRAKRPESEPLTPISGRLERLEADQVALSSALESISITMKRLSSRTAVQEHRARAKGERSEAPPLGTPKAELLRHYGMAGKIGPEFARAQMEIERSKPERSN